MIRGISWSGNNGCRMWICHLKLALVRKGPNQDATRAWRWKEPVYNFIWISENKWKLNWKSNRAREITVILIPTYFGLFTTRLPIKLSRKSVQALSRYFNIVNFRTLKSKNRISLCSENQSLLQILWNAFADIC